MRKTVVLVGVGRCGQQSLEALLRYPEPLHIVAIDPDAARHAEAAGLVERLTSADMGHTIYIGKDLGETPASADFAVISSDLKSTFQSVKALLACCRPAAVLLEKAAFERPQHYHEISLLLERQGIPSWINCSRPVWPGYQWLMSRVQGQRGNVMVVSGGLWNLQANAVHMLDCFTRTSNEPLLALDGAGLDPVMSESAFAGNLELTGQLTGRGINGGRVILICQNKPGLPLRVDWFSPQGRYRIEETAETVTFENEDSQWETRSEAFGVVFARQMTPVYQDILNTQTCQLTPFQTAATLHVALLQELAPILTASFRPKAAVA